MKLTSIHHDRAAGALVGMAAGDALGAGYEFARIKPGQPIGMIGGGLGNFAPGEWTDDTSMAITIAEVGAKGYSFTSSAALDGIAKNFVEWYDSSPPDIGIQTAGVLSNRDSLASKMLDSSARYARFNYRNAGNGSLMRTTPVALGMIHNSEEEILRATELISKLTHYDDVAAQACQIWVLAVRYAILHGNFSGVHLALQHLGPVAQDYWLDLLLQAENGTHKDFPNNGWVVHALQTAWWAIVNSSGDGPAHIEEALEICVRAGGDTDTTAAIAGGLLGAVYGVSAIKAEWRRKLHGWPGYDYDDLVRLAYLSVNGGVDSRTGWPSEDELDYRPFITSRSAVHPHDDGVLLGGYDMINAPVDAVVSLCRAGLPDEAEEHITFWLVDDGAVSNANLEFTIDDAARTVKALRSEGKRVVLHCVEGKSRTPSVAAAYSRLLGEDPYDVLKAMPWAEPNPELWKAATR